MKARTLEQCQGVSCFTTATPASGAMILACRVNAFTTATRRGHFGTLSGSGFQRLLYAHLPVPFSSYWLMIGLHL
jgi:hypothetical protein